MKLRLGTSCFLLALKEDQGIACWLPVAEVEDDVPLRDSEIAEEISDFADADRVWETTHLESLVLVTWVHEV